MSLSNKMLLLSIIASIANESYGMQVKSKENSDLNIWQADERYSRKQRYIDDYKKTPVYKFFKMYGITNFQEILLLVHYAICQHNSNIKVERPIYLTRNEQRNLGDLIHGLNYKYWPYLAVYLNDALRAYALQKEQSMYSTDHQFLQGQRQPLPVPQINLDAPRQRQLLPVPQIDSNAQSLQSNLNKAPQQHQMLPGITDLSQLDLHKTPPSQRQRQPLPVPQVNLNTQFSQRQRQPLPVPQINPSAQFQYSQPKSTETFDYTDVNTLLNHH